MKVLRTIKAIALVAVFMLTATAALAEFEYKGYLRIGKVWANGLYGYEGDYGLITTGNAQKYYGRLGKETSQQYMENTLVNSWMIDGTSIWAKTVVTQTLETAVADGDVGQSVGGAIDSRIRQTYVEMGGLGFMPDASFWVGRKFLNRQDVHILDWYFLDMSGVGFGAVNIANIGLDLALVSWDKGAAAQEGKGEDYANSFVAKFENKMVRVDAVYSTRAVNDAGAPDGTSGYFVSAQFKPENFFYAVEGSSFIAVGYAAGTNAENLWWGSRITKTEDNGTDVNDKTTAWQVVVSGVAQVMPNLSINPVIGAIGISSPKERKTSPPAWTEDATAMRLFAAVRPHYNVTKNIAVDVEIGFYQVSASTDTANIANWAGLPAGEKSCNAWKVTPALVLVMDEGYWSRPQLRFFANYEGVSSNLKPAGGTWVDKGSLLTYGCQAEAWW